MQRNMYSFLVVTFILILATACGKKSEQELVGYWMRGDGYTISFTDDSYCSFGDDAPEQYKTYDTNRLQIVNNDGSGVREFVYEIDGDILLIRLAKEDGYTEFTKNKEEQQKILEEMRKWEEIAAQEQIIFAQIDEYQAIIDELQAQIAENNDQIQANNDEISMWEDDIEYQKQRCQDAIDFGDDKEYQEHLRDEMIAKDECGIQVCKDAISELEANNSTCEEKIKQLTDTIEKLEDEKEKL